jgi:hypothetical protein
MKYSHKLNYQCAVCGESVRPVPYENLIEAGLTHFEQAHDPSWLDGARRAEDRRPPHQLGVSRLPDF